MGVSLGGSSVRCKLPRLPYRKVTLFCTCCAPHLCCEFLLNRPLVSGGELSVSGNGASFDVAGTSESVDDGETIANKVYGLQLEDWSHAALSVVVVGASGMPFSQCCFQLQ